MMMMISFQMDAMSTENRAEHLQLRLRWHNPGVRMRAGLRRARAFQNGSVQRCPDRFRPGRNRCGFAHQFTREKAHLQSDRPAQHGLPRRAELRRGGH